MQIQKQTRPTAPSSTPHSSNPFYDPNAPPAPKQRGSKPAKHTKHIELIDNLHWYWETIPPTATQKQQADQWFTKQAKPQFLRSVALFRQFPVSDVPEIAFVGRSNVGKSSLLNALVNADIKQGLARTSKTPGCTRTLNLYGVGPHDGVRVKPGKNNGHDRIVGVGGLMIVDLPGYGEGSLAEWGTEIMKYLVNRKQLRRVFLLVDAAHGIKDGDRSLMHSLRLAGVPHQVILSKMDRVYLPKGKDIKRMDNKAKNTLEPRGSVEGVIQKMKEIQEEIQPPTGAGALGELLSVSAEVNVGGRKLGIDAVRVAVLQAAGVKFDPKKGKVVVPMRTPETDYEARREKAVAARKEAKAQKAIQA